MLASTAPALQRLGIGVASAPALQRLGIDIASARHLSHAAVPSSASAPTPPPLPPPPTTAQSTAAGEVAPKASAASTSGAPSGTPPPPPSPPPPPPPPPLPPPASGAASGSAGAVGAGARAAVGRRGKASQTSSWLWRTIYLTAGAGAAAAAAQYTYNPAPMDAAAKAMYDNMDARIRYFTEPSRDKLLPDAVRPYPEVEAARTLVIGLEDTLVHSTYSRATGWRVAKRPGAEAFLAYMATFYEIVVFTSNMDSYADPILSRLDPNGWVRFRLYRVDSHYKDGVHVKDMSHLNRDLGRVIVIDHDERCVSMQPENAILIPEWHGDPADTALLDLIPVLEGVVREDVADVREVLGLLRGKRVAEGVAEYRAMAKTRAQHVRGASVFGHVGPVGGADPAAAGAQAGGAPLGQQDGAQGEGGIQGADDAQAGRRSVWRAMPGRARLFQTQAKPAQEGKDGS